MAPIQRSTNASHQYQYPGDYTVTLHAYNDIGCEDTAMRQFMKVIPDKVLIIPNVFSPNGDGANDTWEIAGVAQYYQLYGRDLQSLWSAGIQQSWL